MNNACPGCGAVYAVTSRDIGRKLKCKKCSMALVVTDSGLVTDTPGAVPAAAADDFDTGDDGGVVRKKAKKYGGGDLIEKIGGIPTVLFGFGLFLVVVFYFMPKISEASVDRAVGGLDRVKLEERQEIRKIEDAKDPKDMKPEDFDSQQKDIQKVKDKYKKPKNEAADDATLADISKKRSVWWDRYGQMFGFLFLSFGCIGFIRGDQHLVVKIVGAAILVAMMLVVFGSVGGCVRG